jgi:hypothetical protein
MSNRSLEQLRANKESKRSSELMANDKGFGSFQESDSYWPPAHQNDSARYYPPSDFDSASSWADSTPIPAQVFRRAEARVASQRRFFKRLFLYLAIVSAFWIIGISTLIISYPNPKMVSIFLPLFITVVGGIRLAWSFFNTFIWELKSYEERVMREAHKLVH